MNDSTITTGRKKRKKRKKTPMDSSIRNFTRDSQLLGQTEEEDAVLSLVLKKEYCDIDETNDNRLLWKSHIEKVIKSGTLSRLVQQLAPHGEEIDHSYRTSFLAVYRTFATPTELLQELIEWYKKLYSISEVKPKDTDKGITLRSVLSFIRLWLEKYINDFDTPPSCDLLAILEGFLTEETKNPLLSTEVSELLRHVLGMKQKLVSSAGRSTVKDYSEERAIGDWYDWLQFTPVQIAWDLTALDADMFGSLVPHECLHYIRKQTDRSLTIYKTIQHFNNVICLVITTVLQPNGSINDSLRTSSSYEGELSLSSFTSDSTSIDDLDRSDLSDSCSNPCSGSSIQRGRCISHWIDIAHQCRLLKNFSSLKAIVFGLQSSSVSRLAQSWISVSSERQSVFRELLDLFSSDSNFQIFREVVNKEATGKRADISPHKKTRLLKNTGTNNTNDVGSVVIGVIPYLGTFLSDLTMLHNALPDKNKDGQINFEKRRKEFEILAKISLFQTASSKYNLPKNSSLYHWIYHTHLLSENDSYHLSIQLEPPVSSPIRNIKSASPLCETFIRRSLRLLKHKGNKKTVLSVPSDPRIRKSFDSCVDDDDDNMSTCTEDGSSIHRSSSCIELNEHLVVKVTISGQQNTCVYKSIHLSKSDHTSKVIQVVLDKHGLSITDADKYQLCQQLSGKGYNNKGKLSLIPAGACVYYALTDTTIQPKLYVQLKEIGV